MSVTVRIPSPLRTLTGGAREVAVPSGTVRDVIGSLEAAHPGTEQRLLDDDGKARRFVTLFVGDEDVRFLNGIETKVEDGQTLSIVPATAGG